MLNKSILIVSFLVAGCCPYALKCSPDNSLAKATCTAPIEPKDKTFEATVNALGDNVKLYKECRASCVR
jgi:hypothetical protein